MVAPSVNLKNLPWDLTPTTIDAFAETTSPALTNIQRRGFVWSTTVGTPTVDLAGQATAGCTAWVEFRPVGGFSATTFEHLITGLAQGQLYNVRAFAIIGDAGGPAPREVGYSGVTQARPSGPPTVTSDANTTGITQRNATGGGTVTDDGSSTILERGILVSIIGHQCNYSNNDFKFVPSPMGTTGHFSLDCIDGTHPSPGPLTPDTDYQWRAFARNARNPAGTASTGALRTFRTLAVASTPTVANNSLLAPTAASVVPTAHVTNVGGYPITQCGFIYLVQAATPTDAQLRLGQPGVGVAAATVPSPNTGPFAVTIPVTANIPGSEQAGGAKVWVRAYATNGQAGTTFGYSPIASVFTPVDLQMFAELHVLGAGEVAASGGSGGADLVDLVGFCDIPIESDKFTIEDSRVRIEQESDPLCRQANMGFVEVLGRLLGLDTPVDLAPVTASIEIDGGAELQVNAQLRETNRSFHHGTSQHGVEPKRRQPERVLNANGKIVRDGLPRVEGHDVGPPPPPPPPKIAPPHGLTPSNLTASSVRLTWAASTDPSVVGYRVYQLFGTIWIPIDEFTGPSRTVTAPARTYVVDGLSSSHVYTFRVTAISDTDESNPSGTQTITTLSSGNPPPPARPGAPTSLHVDPGSTNASVDWDPNPLSQHVTSYRIYQLIAGTFQVVKTVAGTVQTTTVGGLTANSPYQFRITAVNAQGESDPSKIAKIRTDASGGANVVTLPLTGSDAFDATGVHDISIQLQGWLNDTSPDNVRNGADIDNRVRVIFPKTKLGGGRATYRIDGGLNRGVVLQQMHNVIFDGGGTGRGLNGAHLIEVSKHPFVAEPDDAANPAGSPGGVWNVVYGSDSSRPVAFRFTTPSGSATVRQAAIDRAATYNREKSMWRPRKCTGLTFRGFQITGTFNRDYQGGTGFDPNYEAQDGLIFEGCSVIEIANCTIEKMWGNGFEAVVYANDQDTPDPSDDEYIPTTDIWCHDTTILHMGRQTMSLTYGGRFIIEDCTLGLTERSLIDAEPVNRKTWTGETNGPGVRGIYLIDSVILQHNLGILSIHPGVDHVLCARNRGYKLNTSGIDYGEQVIFEDNVETDTQIPNYAYEFARAEANDDSGSGNSGNHWPIRWGGVDIIVRNNKNEVHRGGACVRLRAGQGGVSNFSIHDNDVGGEQQVLNEDGSPWNGTFAPFSLPLPDHPLRP